MKQREDGQTLIALLIFILVAMTITIAATAVAIINIQANNSFTTGEQALAAANSGIEDAVIQLERNPSYSGGTMPIANGTATITVSGTGTQTIVSIGSVGHFQRTVTATASTTANIVTVTNWSETP